MNEKMGRHVAIVDVPVRLATTGNIVRNSIEQLDVDMFQILG